MWAGHITGNDLFPMSISGSPILNFSNICSCTIQILMDIIKLRLHCYKNVQNKRHFGLFQTKKDKRWISTRDEMSHTWLLGCCHN